MPLYNLVGASRSFHAPTGEPIAALQNVTLRIERGQRIALIGPSGAGKTTLFRLLNGTLRTTAGRVCFDGVCMEDMDEAALREMRSRIGTVYQAQHLVYQLPAYQNVLAGKLGAWSPLEAILARFWPSPADLARARECLEQVEIPEKWAAPTYTLSGGQRQRLAVARVLMQDPPVILADEPVSALDPALAREILTLLLGLQGERTLVVSLHTVDLALEFFPRIVALRNGEVFFDLPRHEVSRELLDELFRHSGPGERITATAAILSPGPRDSAVAASPGSAPGSAAGSAPDAKLGASPGSAPKSPDLAPGAPGAPPGTPGAPGSLPGICKPVL